MSNTKTVCEVQSRGFIYGLLHNMTRDSLAKCGITMNGDDKCKNHSI